MKATTSRNTRARSPQASVRSNRPTPGGLAHDLLQGALEQREPAEFDLPELGDRVGSLRVLDPGAPEGGGKIGVLGRGPLGLRVHRLDSRSISGPRALEGR
jgi:hypothetical protein